jgi:uncharacterized protein YkwD
VTLATRVPRERCQAINLGYLDPDTIDLEAWQNREDEGILLTLVNDVRAEVDLPPVLADAALTAAARAHSEDMAEGGFCAHEGSDGRDVSDRLAAFGFDGRRHGEVVSCRTDSPAEAMAQWLRGLSGG